jgi:hypothetical protein
MQGCRGFEVSHKFFLIATDILFPHACIFFEPTTAARLPSLNSIESVPQQAADPQKATLFDIGRIP